MVDNPYVGPRTFTRQESDRFFGREQEADDLRALVMTERLVLFYAQSGAGKSSLINTRLIPHLQAAGLAVLPIGRVSGELPEGVTDVDNIFIFNLLLSLEQGNSPPQRLSRMTLPTFLTHLASDDGEHYYFDDSPPPDEADYQNPRHILIIDQFEEIVTSHLECWPEREDFFRQLNQVMLEDPQLWVLLTLREDHLAALEPYAPLLRDKMRARYYMPQMGSEAALAAVREPAQQFGRPFATDVAETLVDNLRQIRGSLAADIGSGRRLGQFVEPVQLQVVCYQLWENLKYSPPGEITAHDLQTYGNVDVTLTDFYESALQAAVQQTGLSERRLRSWFSTRLITPTHTRDMVFRDEQTGQTEGLPNAAVDVLTNAYIIRADTRSSGTWYELTHDRLVEPILEANLRWKADYHNPVATAYRVWHDSGRIPEKLLRGEALAEAQTFADTRPAEITDEERAFLADSARQAEAEQELARQRAQRQRYTIIGIMLIAILMGLLAVWGWRSADWAEVEAERAIRAEADALNQANAAATAEARAQIQAQQAGDNARFLAIAQLTAVANARDAEAQAEAAETARRTAEVARATAEAARAIAEVETRRAKLANARTVDSLALNLLEQKAQTAMLLALEARKLSAAASQEVIQQAPYHFPPIETTLHGHSESALTVAWSPDGTTLASSAYDNKIIIWDVGTFKPIKTLEQPDGSNTYELSWSPDGQKLAATAGLESIIWDVPSGEYDTLKQGSGTVVSVAWSPDGQKLASGLADATVVVWDLASSPLVSQTLRGHQDIVNHVAWSPAGTELASASDDRQIIVYPIYGFR